MIMKKSLWLFVVLLSQTLIAQNVGIGTTNPQSTLDLKGNQRIGGAVTYMTFDSLSGKIVWSNANLFVPVTQALMKHSAAADGLFYNNSGGTTGQLEYRNALGDPVFFTNFTNGRGYFKSRLGIATVTPLAGLHVADSSVLFSANGDVPGFPGLPPMQGAGRRLQWYPDKAAFRAGFVDNDQWDQTNIGNYSFAAGNGTLASGSNSTALGFGTNASGIASTAFGNSSVASGDYTFAIGTNAIANGIFASAIGYNSIASGAGATAMGIQTKAIGLHSTALGDSTKASGDYTTAMGYHTTASGLSATAMGENTLASGLYSTAMGIQTQAISYNTTAMGGGTIASGYGSAAMGHFTIAKAFGSLSTGVLNDDTDNPDEFTPDPLDRMFQIGNGTDLPQRSNAFTVLRNGNTGIGLSDPPFRLSFDPSIGDKISLWSNSSNSYGFGIQSGLLQIHTDVSYANIAFGFGSSDVMTERMRIVNSGSIGMELSGRIYLKNGTSPINPDDSPGIWLYNADNSGLLGFMGTQNNQNLGFYGGPGGWGFVYDALNSKVGIGTATPAYAMDVRGNGDVLGRFENLSPSNSAIGLISSCSTSPGDGIGMYGIGGAIGVYGGATGGGSDVRIGVAGYGLNGDLNYGTQGFAYSDVGTTAIALYGAASGSGTNWAGYFNGAVYATSYSSSDRKLKQDIHKLDNAISIIRQLNPTLYSYKTHEFEQMQLPEGIHYGLIADEVQQVIPGIVKKAVQPAQYENNDQQGKMLSDAVEFNAVNYTEIITILVGAVKEQQKQIDELKLLVEELLKK
jgi:Chaperone of endosialidase/Head domain of trimeric autotransporter adhesin